MKQILYLALIVSIISCKENNSQEKKSVEKAKNSQQIDNPKNGKNVALNFIKRLKNGENVSSLFGDTWTFKYHEDNRCTGSTDGKVTYNGHIKLDNKVRIKVKNDSEHAWACEKKEAYYYEMIFDLKEKIKTWERIELDDDSDTDTTEKEAKTFYILGRGASDYIRIHINENNLISTFKYSSEDPG